MQTLGRLCVWGGRGILFFEVPRLTLVALFWYSEVAQMTHGLSHRILQMEFAEP